jgi:hypothetical protein
MPGKRRQDTLDKEAKFYRHRMSTLDALDLRTFPPCRSRSTYKRVKRLSPRRRTERAVRKTSASTSPLHSDGKDDTESKYKSQQTHCFGSLDASLRHYQAYPLFRFRSHIFLERESGARVGAASSDSSPMRVPLAQLRRTCMYQFSNIEFVDDGEPKSA